MGFIADLSRYDPVEAVDLYDGVILNVEDPGYEAKRDRAIARGVPWGVYSWVYPGKGPAAIERVHGIDAPLGVWLDYEQAGVQPVDLSAALTLADGLGMRVGVYTYLYILPTVKDRIGDHPLWLAYYPGRNDGVYAEGFSEDARRHGALLHQFTSSEGRRDLNVVLDQTRWATWTNIPTAEPAKELDGMVLYHTVDPDTYFRDAAGILIRLSIDDAKAYFDGIKEGWVHVVQLGGALGAVAFNVNTIKQSRAASEVV